jgi:hypothetical protein
MTAAGPAAASRPPIQKTACDTAVAVGPPRHNARSASTVTVIGLTFAKACSQPGNVATGTNVGW